MADDNVSSAVNFPPPKAPSATAAFLFCCGSPNDFPPVHVLPFGGEVQQTRNTSFRPGLAARLVSKIPRCEGSV